MITIQRTPLRGTDWTVTGAAYIGREYYRLADMAARAPFVRGSLTIVLLLATYVGCKESPPPTDPSTGGTAATATAPASTASDEPASTGGTSASTSTGPMPTVCKRDAECTLSTFAGCCTCCPRLPHAFLRTALAWHEARCAKVDCPPCNTPCGPEPSMSGYNAECVKDACISVAE